MQFHDMDSLPDIGVALGPVLQRVPADQQPLLIVAEYGDHVGWVHSALDHAIAFAALTDTRHLVTFHHDPAHDDEDVDRLTTAAVAAMCPSFPVTPGAEGATFDLA